MAVDLKRSARLRAHVHYKEWEDLFSYEYKTTGIYKKEGTSGLVYKCPGCREPVFLNSMPDSKPRWDIDYAKLTATPSIVHDKEKGGCGWHGYLTNGLLEPC